MLETSRYWIMIHHVILAQCLRACTERFRDGFQRLGAMPETGLWRKHLPHMRHERGDRSGIGVWAYTIETKGKRMLCYVFVLVDIGGTEVALGAYGKAGTGGRIFSRVCWKRAGVGWVQRSGTHRPTYQLISLPKAASSASLHPPYPFAANIRIFEIARLRAGARAR